MKTHYDMIKPRMRGCVYLCLVRQDITDYWVCLCRHTAKMRLVALEVLILQQGWFSILKSQHEHTFRYVFFNFLTSGQTDHENRVMGRN